MKYEILGETLPVVVCELEEGESLYSEAGAMSWMSPSMKMQTTSKGLYVAALKKVIRFRELL